VFCQLAYLRHCLRGRIRRALDDLPDTLDETYARTLEDIGDQNWECAHRLFQCVAVASRPLHVKELAEFLAFDFEEGPTPTFLAEWRPDDPVHAVLSTCSSLLAVVTVGGSSVIQFAHFSVKEYLTSGRLAKAKDTVSRFHVSLISAHTIVAQACLGVLLHLDENITKDGLEDFPLALYAAEHWVNHARFESVESKVQDGMKRFFDPGKSHLSVWDWIYNPGREPPALRYNRSENPTKASGTPLHYAAFSGMHDIATFLIVEHALDVNAWGFYEDETPLDVAMRRGHVEVARVLLEHGADREARDLLGWSPLERASEGGHVELVQVLLEYGADVNARDELGCTPLFWASDLGKPASVRALIKHGADVKASDKDNQTPLHRAGTEEVAQILLEHGADANALESRNWTPLHVASVLGRAGVVRVLLEHGADANARDADNATPLHLASVSDDQDEEELDVIELLLQYGSDIHASDNEGQTPFMRATEAGKERIMQFLLENGVEDHRK
jgi:ankyrin repeat protein